MAMDDGRPPGKQLLRLFILFPYESCAFCRICNTYSFPVCQDRSFCSSWCHSFSVCIRNTPMWFLFSCVSPPRIYSVFCSAFLHNKKKDLPRRHILIYHKFVCSSRGILKIFLNFWKKRKISGCRGTLRCAESMVWYKLVTIFTKSTHLRPFFA